MKKVRDWALGNKVQRHVKWKKQVGKRGIGHVGCGVEGAEMNLNFFRGHMAYGMSHHVLPDVFCTSNMLWKMLGLLSGLLQDCRHFGPTWFSISHPFS